MAYDADGTIILGAPTTSPLGEPSGSAKIELNDEDNVELGVQTGIPAKSSNQGDTPWDWIWIFPELREFDGAFIAHNGRDGGSVTTTDESGDTTSGRDGTFSVVDATDWSGNTDGYPTLYRTGIRSYAVSNVRGINFRVQLNSDSGGGMKFQTVHIYGEISAGETPDRLQWFDDDDDLEFSKPQDYGDVPRGSASDHVVYLKNISASLTASSVQITAESLYLNSGSWYTFDEGSGFSATLALASSIANGADSPNITVRVIRPDAAGLGPHVARVYANAPTWA